MNKATKYAFLVFLGTTGLNTNAQTTYFTGFDTYDEKKNWVEYQTGKTITGWSVMSGGNSAPNRIINTAPTGDANKDSLVDWYVSPKFDFSKGGSIDSVSYNYFSYFGTHLSEQSVGVYALSGSPDPSLATSVTLLADFTPFYSGDVNHWIDTGGFTVPILTDEAYIAFKFVAIDGWSSISFDDLKITMNKTVGIEDIDPQLKLISVYPNPSNGELRLRIPSQQNRFENYAMDVFSMQGKKLWGAKVKTNSSISLDLPKGNYFYKITNEQGTVCVVNKLIILE